MYSCDICKRQDKYPLSFSYKPDHPDFNICSNCRIDRRRKEFESMSEEQRKAYEDRISEFFATVEDMLKRGIKILSPRMIFDEMNSNKNKGKK